MKDKAQLRAVQKPCRQDHIDMISQPNFWPSTFLPLIKQVGSQKTFGVIFKLDAILHNFVVKYGNLFSLPKSYPEYAMLEGIEYTTIEELLDDGWVVD